MARSIAFREALREAVQFLYHYTFPLSIHQRSGQCSCPLFLYGKLFPQKIVHLLIKMRLSVDEWF